LRFASQSLSFKFESSWSRASFMRFRSFSEISLRRVCPIFLNMISSWRDHLGWSNVHFKTELHSPLPSSVRTEVM
jgi:hypothetical protein